MVAGLGLATPAASQDVSIAGREFVAAWKTLIGQTVQITGGRVYGARLDSALLSLEGGSIVLSPPFSQGELRYIVEHCAAYRGGPCEMSRDRQAPTALWKRPRACERQISDPESVWAARQNAVFRTAVTVSLGNRGLPKCCPTVDQTYSVLSGTLFAPNL